MKGKFFIRAGGRVVTFQVLEMDERFRAQPNSMLSVSHTTPWLYVASGRRPELFGKSVYLRGDDRTADDDLVFITFRTSDEAKDYGLKLRRSLIHWAKHAEVLRPLLLESPTDLCKDILTV